MQNCRHSPKVQPMWQPYGCHHAQKHLRQLANEKKLKSGRKILKEFSAKRFAHKPT